MTNVRLSAADVDGNGTPDDCESVVSVLDPGGRRIGMVHQIPPPPTTAHTLQVHESIDLVCRDRATSGANGRNTRL